MQDVLVAAAIKPRFRVCPARIPPRLNGRGYKRRVFRSALKARSDFTPGNRKSQCHRQPADAPSRTGLMKIELLFSTHPKTSFGPDRKKPELFLENN